MATTCAKAKVTLSQLQRLYFQTNHVSHLSHKIKPCQLCSYKSSRLARLYCKVASCQEKSGSSERNQSVPKWQSVVGLEIHAQIKSASKLFSGAGTEFGVSPNMQVSLFDAALPGTLPVLNRQCVLAAVRTAQALNCDINRVSKFDRKHYFYADMPAGYQITQQRQPLAKGGNLTYVFQCSRTSSVERRAARLVQVQLEQDSGKSLHDGENGLSLIDLNRAGVGLMEIVTAPDFTCGDDAASFVRDLRDLLVALDTCDGKMAEGSLRVDANISVRLPGQPLGTRTEVKNLNSTRNIRLAVDYEIERQIQVLNDGGCIENETRSFDAEDGQTVPMRDKERLLDYRFMPEPNLPPLVIKADDFNPPKTSTTSSTSDAGNSSGVDNFLEKTRARVIPILPEEMRKRLEEEYNVPLIHSVVLVRQGLFALFETLVTQHACSARSTTAVLKTPFTAFIDELGVTPETSPVSIGQLAELIHIFDRGDITSTSLSVVLKELASNPDRPCQDIVEEKGLWVVSNEAVISAAIDDVLARNPQNVKAYRKGKINQLKVFTSKVIKILDGKANASQIQQLIKDKLDK